MAFWRHKFPQLLQGFFWAVFLKMKQSRADSKCPLHLHSHYTSLIYETSSFPKNLQVPQKYLDNCIRCKVYRFTWVMSHQITSHEVMSMYVGFTCTKATVTTIIMACKKNDTRVLMDQSSTSRKSNVWQGEWAGTYHGDTDSIIKLTHQHTDDSGCQQQQDERVFKLETKRKRR